LCVPANALDPNRHISQCGHTVWRVQDGAIDPAGEIAQTADGYGLGLKEDKSGNIWFGSSVLCRWRQGSAKTYLNELRKHQDAGDGVSEVAVGSSGEIWAAIDGVGQDLGIRHFFGGKWAAYVIPGLATFRRKMQRAKPLFSHFRL
jgi:hypothetical protein